MVDDLLEHADTHCPDTVTFRPSRLLAGPRFGIVSLLDLDDILSDLDDSVPGYDIIDDGVATHLDLLDLLSCLHPCPHIVEK